MPFNEIREIFIRFVDNCFLDGDNSTSESPEAHPGNLISGPVDGFRDQSRSSGRGHRRRLPSVLTLGAAVIAIATTTAMSGQADLGPFYQIGEPESGGIMSVHPADDRRRVEPVHDVITPHIPLALTTPEGPVEVLAIANDNYGRWPLEIKQRLEVELAVVYTRSSTQFGYHEGTVGLLAEDVEGRLLQALDRRPQVIVSEFKFGNFPDEVQRRIRQLIDAGTGYIGYLEGVDREGFDQRHEVQRKIFDTSVPFAGLRGLTANFETADHAAENTFQLFENDLGHRLAAVWDYPRDGAAPDPSWLMYDWKPRFEEEAWNSLLSRVILWCAGRADEGIKLELPSTVRRPDLPKTIAVEVPLRDENGKVEMLVFDRDARQRHKLEMGMEKERTELELPLLPAGDYFVLTRIYEDAAVRDWFLRSLTVTSEIDIAGIELEQQVIDHEAEITAGISLSSAPLDDMTLTVETIDNFGRIAHRRSIPAAEAVTLEMPTSGSKHIYNYINVKLFDVAGELVAENRHSFTIRQPDLPLDDLVTRMWGAGGTGRHWHRPWKHARDGLDVTRGNPEGAALHNMRAEVGAANIRGINMVSPTESQAAGRRVNTEMVRETAETWSDHPIFQIHLGDDFSFNENWNDYSRGYLANWTEERYETIESLNQAWNTDYREFSDVTPIEYAEAAAAYGTDQPAYGNLCRWVDQQLAREDMLIDFIAELNREIKEIDPRIPLALNNTIRYPSPNSGFNFWKLAEVFDNVGAYANPITHDVYRSARARDSRHGLYTGCYGVYQYPPYYAMRHIPWWSVFQNMNAHAYWYGVPNYQYFPSVLAPDLGTLLGYRKAQKNVEELKQGTAKMLFNSERQNDGIAVLYSQGSINATAFLGKIGGESDIPPLPEPHQWTSDHLDYSGGDQHAYMNSWEGLTNLVKDIGFNYDAVSEECLRQGALAEGGFSLLLLPMSVRLDSEAVAAIREFVREGGTVLADFLPGLFDDRMRPAATGTLADMFGVEYAGGLLEMILGQAFIKERADEILGLDEYASVEGGIYLGSYLSVSDITLQGAVALARNEEQVPLMMIHEYGQGKAIMLNMLARDYQLWRALGRELPLRQSVAAVLKQAGMNPRVEIHVHAGRRHGLRPLQATEKVRFIDGVTEYVGILRDFSLRPDERIIMSDMRAHPARINFGRQAHVYDVREGVYRGYRQTIDEMIHPARAKLYTLLPYEIRGFNEVEKEFSAGENRIDIQMRLTVSGDTAPGRHLARVEVTGPEGRQRREHAANILFEDGLFSHSIPLGYDPEPGYWRVNVRDVATGTAVSCVIEVGVDE